ncbi:uncharacterized protein LOC113236035 [Hyposmocoma kahamanoa]|uniref:uncharacterized protein LOC113236035 n=1 Tax=Hyposmocoma kahamanoa TaxID=1477025 RepID=UPI000E6DA150|nr:uncharacterized protein LOC113236035 [Hyposmocoma kahamanoa]
MSQPYNINWVVHLVSKIIFVVIVDGILFYVWHDVITPLYQQELFKWPPRWLRGDANPFLHPMQLPAYFRTWNIRKKRRLRKNRPVPHSTLAVEAMTAMIFRDTELEVHECPAVCHLVLPPVKIKPKKVLEESPWKDIASIPCEKDSLNELSMYKKFLASFQRMLIK